MVDWFGIFLLILGVLLSGFALGFSLGVKYEEWREDE